MKPSSKVPSAKRPATLGHLPTLSATERSEICGGDNAPLKNVSWFV